MSGIGIMLYGNASPTIINNTLYGPALTTAEGEGMIGVLWGLLDIRSSTGVLRNTFFMI